MSSIPDTMPMTRDEDEFRLGWRFVEHVGPDGTKTTVQVGLTPQDVLHPLEGDHIVQTHLHHQFVLNVALSVERLLLGRAGVRYRVDQRTDWGNDEILPHAPDVVVFDNGHEPNPAAGTIHLAELGCRPLVVFEVTSPSTRDNDLDTKVDHYYAVNVPLYIIVDLGPDPERRVQLRLLGYQAGDEGYEELPLDEEGRLHVEALGLVLAIEDDWLCCYDEDEHVLANRVEITRRVAELEVELATARENAATAIQNAATANENAATNKKIAEEQSKIAEEQSKIAEEQSKRADTAEKRASDAEARILAMEAELTRLRGTG